MTFELQNRNAKGILAGNFSQGRASFPIDVPSHVVPFLYPCQECGAVKLHVVGEHHAGIAFKIPFMSRPLASSHKTYYAICNSCTGASSTISKKLIRDLQNGVIPHEGFAKDWLGESLNSRIQSMAIAL